MALVFLSGSAQAQQGLTDLINTSQSIVNTFDLGIRTVAGMTSYSYDGGIAPAGMAETAYIQKNQADAYNAAVAAFSGEDYAYTAAEYAQDQKVTADMQMQESIEAYVQAAYAVIEVTRINNMAEEIGATNTAEGEARAQELQAYIAGNDVILDDAEVLAYNDGLAGIESAASELAAFTAIAVDAELQASLESSVADMGESLRNAENAYFAEGTSNLIIEFSGAATQVALDMSLYFKTTTEILDRGAADTFYTTGPTQSRCFFAQTEEEYVTCQQENSGA